MMLNKINFVNPILSFFQLVKCVIGYRIRGIRRFNHFGTEETVRVLDQSSDKSLRMPIPAVVWIYWHEPEIPVFIEKIIAHNKTLLAGYEVRILNKNSVHTYLSNLFFAASTLVAHQADLIRLELLARYGGIWLDATVVLGANLNWVTNIAMDRKFDIIGYYSERNTIDQQFPMIETWFIAAPSHNEFIKQWRDEFAHIKRLGSRVYHEQLQKREDYFQISQRISRPAYLMLNLAEQIVSRSPLGINAHLKRCEDSAFYVQEALGWDNYAINYMFTQRVVPASFSIIKLTAGDRMFVSQMHRFGLLNRRSLVGQLVAEKNRSSEFAIKNQQHDSTS